MLKTRVLVVAAVLSLAFGCSKKNKDADDDRQSNVENAAGAAFVEQFERGTVSWNVKSDGQVLARIEDDGGSDISKDVKGSISWTEGDDTRTAPLEYDAKVAALVAKGPPLQQDLTEVRYTLISDGEPVAGALHVPANGTAALNADAKVAAKISVDGAVAPHGGVIQVVGDDRLEIVADDDSDEVRVYLLDASWQPVAIVDRKITIAVGGVHPEVVVFAPAPGNAYFVGHWHVVGEPPRLTVSVKRPKVGVRVAIVGWHPGVKIRVGGGPKVKVKVKGGVVFGPKVDVKVNGGGPKVMIKGGGGPAMVKVNPKGKVKIKL